MLDAFLAGLEKRKASGGSLKGIESVASFFISRVDIENDRRLSEVEAQGGENGGSAARLRGQAAVANARLAYQVYEEMLVAALAGSRGSRRSPTAIALGLNRREEQHLQ